MSTALFWSGGKDSLLALDRAQRQGLDVTHLVNLFEGNSQRVRFHGVRKELIEAQARALGKTLLQRFTHPESFEQAFQAAMAELEEAGIDSIAFGNIHLADIRAWYEERVTANGFRHVEPLWGDAPAKLVREFVQRGHRSRIVSVYLTCGRREWLGREFTTELIEELERTPNVDVCGERGEYHSFAFGGPLFRWNLPIRNVGQFEVEQHLILDLALEESGSSANGPDEPGSGEAPFTRGAAKLKRCGRCGARFLCGPQRPNGGCWCEEMPAITPRATFGTDCLCATCLGAFASPVFVSRD